MLSVAPLPDFGEVVQMVVVGDSLSFIVKAMSAWYREHFRAFELCLTSEISLIHFDALVDQYSLEDYKIGGRRMVTLKRFVLVQG